MGAQRSYTQYTTATEASLHLSKCPFANVAALDTAVHGYLHPPSTRGWAFRGRPSRRLPIEGKLGGLAIQPGGDKGAGSKGGLHPNVVSRPMQLSPNRREFKGVILERGRASAPCRQPCGQDAH